MKIHQQRGMTLIGFVMVMSVVIFAAFIGMKVGPLYLEYYSVVTALKGIAAEKGSARITPHNLRVKVLNRLYVSYSDHVRESDIKVIRKNGVHLRVKYEVRENVMGNLDVITSFDKSVKLSD